MPHPPAAQPPRRVTILGSTGSIGCSTVDLVRRHPQRFPVQALVAGKNVELLAQQARLLNPRMAVIADPAGWAPLREALAGTAIEAHAGDEAVLAAAAGDDTDWVMAAITGGAGLMPTLAALRKGRMIALANKEALVMAGALMLEEARQYHAPILPVDSEHNAIFQVFEEANRDGIDRLVLTASGGPFRNLSSEQMRHVTPGQAARHPNWEMGIKVSLDSATMMNKGLELIEASFLFAMPEETIGILVHPQSIIHSMVGYRDGSVLAQLGTPDMRTPIAYTLGWPQRMESPARKLDLAAIARLDFEPPDEKRFPALRLARDALRAGGGAPAILNAANEVAVERFTRGIIGFPEIAALVEEVLGRMDRPAVDSIEAVLELDRATRLLASELADRPARYSPPPSATASAGGPEAFRPPSPAEAGTD